MKKKTKHMLLRIAVLAAVTALVIVGGYLERGYFVPAAETILIPLGIGWIIYERREEEQRWIERNSKKKEHLSTQCGMH